ncbi:hypothetical protein WA026_001612 [Henosepilachna vigintioctopunctata]|uniref:Uncharacterized protein n=1 Tax=Henosepilachna vigintioctopunctata TaxID=420089 RepID=A0AAW1UIJ5_9CUCU
MQKPVNQVFLDKIHSNESLRIFNDQCNEELSRLKKIQVGNTNVTLDVILKSFNTASAKYSRNSEILEWFQNFELAQYKIFGALLNRHFKEVEEYGYTWIYSTRIQNPSIEFIFSLKSAPGLSSLEALNPRSLFNRRKFLIA